MSPAKTSTLTPAQRAKTTLANPVGSAVKRQAKAVAGNGTVRIIATDTVKANTEAKIASIIASIGFDEVQVAKGEGSLLTEVKRYRRMFPAAPDVISKLGADAPDLYGQTTAYREAWKGVKAEALNILSARLQESGVPRTIADDMAKARTETDRKAISVQYRNDLEAEVRATIANPYQRAVFMLAHGFRYQSNVVNSATSPMCIPAKDSKVERDEKTGALVLTVPGHIVNPKAGTIKPVKAVTAGNQDGKGDVDKKSDVQKSIDALSARLGKKDQLGILESVNGLINGLIGLVAPIDSTDLATRSRLIVETERSLKNLYNHWGVTTASYAAARKYTAPAIPTDAEVEAHAAANEAASEVASGM